MQTDNLELKKLVYLYLMNYAKTQPDLTIMAVNTFVKDCDDPNPLIRALATRTMGCIRVARISEYLTEPLRKCLKDEDPYVRKTAAVCVAKLFDIDANLVEEQGFITALQELLSDANPMVVANAVAALSEIHDSNPAAGLFELTPATVSKLLAALNECTEWGQIFILDALAIYVPKVPPRPHCRTPCTFSLSLSASCPCARLTPCFAAAFFILQFANLHTCRTSASSRASASAWRRACSTSTRPSCSARSRSSSS